VADHLGATFLTLEEQGRALVEHVMVAGWVLDEGQYVFGQRRRKIVVVRGDRPDMQMAALETDTVGLVLTGGKDPVQYTVYHAEARGVPLLATKLGTVDAMERLAGVQQRVTVHHPDKPNRFLALLDSSGALGSLAASTGMAIAQARAAGAA
jgi:BioD-like phosphotransacetylase family protein